MCLSNAADSYFQCEDASAFFTAVLEVRRMDAFGEAFTMAANDARFEMTEDTKQLKEHRDVFFKRMAAWEYWIRAYIEGRVWFEEIEEIYTPEEEEKVKRIFAKHLCTYGKAKELPRDEFSRQCYAERVAYDVTLALHY